MELMKLNSEISSHLIKLFEPLCVSKLLVAK